MVTVRRTPDSKCMACGLVNVPLTPLVKTMRYSLLSHDRNGSPYHSLSYQRATFASLSSYGRDSRGTKGHHTDDISLIGPSEQEIANTLGIYVSHRHRA